MADIPYVEMTGGVGLGFVTDCTDFVSLLKTSQDSANAVITETKPAAVFFHPLILSALTLCAILGSSYLMV